MRPFVEDFPLGSNRAAAAPLPPDAPIAVVLSAGVGQTIAIPAGARFVGFSFTTDIWVRFGGASTAVVAPVATVTNGSAGELNPATRRIPLDVSHIALTAEVGGKGSLGFWG